MLLLHYRVKCRSRSLAINNNKFLPGSVCCNSTGRLTCSHVSYLKGPPTQLTDPEPMLPLIHFASYKPADSRLKQILESIKQNSRKRLELYATLGVECANIKRAYIKDKCTQHVTSTDLSKFINCLSCNKRNKISSFYTYVKNVTEYSRDYMHILSTWLIYANVIRRYSMLACLLIACINITPSLFAKLRMMMIFGVLHVSFYAAP